MSRISDRPDNESCGDCRFFMDNTNAPGLGWCRRNPPVPICIAVKELPAPNAVIGAPPPQPKLDPLIQSFFPLTPAVNWCGEWKIARKRMQ